MLVLLTGALTLVFGAGGSSDFWVDALMAWWRVARSSHRGIRRLVIYLDNGPDNSGRRTQFLKRMVQFADWSGLVIRLVYYPPYHSKYNPDRAVLVVAGEEVEWGAAQLLGGDPRLRGTHDLAEDAPTGRASAREPMPQRCESRRRK